MLRWFAGGSPPEAASSGTASAAGEAPTAGADLGRAALGDTTLVGGDADG